MTATLHAPTQVARASDTTRVIAASRLDEWVERLLQRYEITAPVAGAGGDTLFATIHGSAEVLWEFENPLLPPKAVLLPQVDPIVQIRRANGHYKVEALRDERPRLLLNARSCDATALAYLRKMYERDLSDDGIRRRAESLVVISLSCPQPCESGFCICCDGGPFVKDGADIQLTPLGREFLAEALSDRGRELLARDDDLFAEADDAALAQRARLEHDALGKFGDETCHVGSAMRRISAKRVSDDLWNELAASCLGCGACNHVCPTCYCFSVADRASGPDEWERARTWDSCQYPAFTMEASGHNPRAARRERVKRRFYHKLSAQYYALDGRTGCVGCGRCVRVCMGSCDMPTVVRAIRHGALETPKGGPDA